MSDGNAWGLTDRSKTQSFRYDGNVHGFMEALNRSKQKRSTITVDLYYMFVTSVKLVQYTDKSLNQMHLQQVLFQ